MTFVGIKENVKVAVAIVNAGCTAMRGSRRDSNIGPQATGFDHI
jgi:hypothetical protein